MSDESQWLWDDFVYQVQEWLDGQDNKGFYIEGRQMTWRNITGFNIVYTDDAEQFIKALVGLDCDYIVRIYDAKDKDNPAHLLTATVYHHDSPTGESRDVYIATEEQLRSLD